MAAAASELVAAAAGGVKFVTGVGGWTGWAWNPGFRGVGGCFKGAGAFRPTGFAAKVFSGIDWGVAAGDIAIGKALAPGPSAFSFKSERNHKWKKREKRHPHHYPQQKN